MPALATTAIFTFIWTWNDFFSQLIYLTDPDMYTVAGRAAHASSTPRARRSWGPMFAMSIVSLVPVFLAFLFGQRYLVKGIATTGHQVAPPLPAPTAQRRPRHPRRTHAPPHRPSALGALLAVAALALTACAGSSGESGRRRPTSSGPPEPVEIRFSWWGSDTRQS